MADPSSFGNPERDTEQVSFPNALFVFNSCFRIIRCLILNLLQFKSHYIIEDLVELLYEAVYIVKKKKWFQKTL